MLVDSHCHLDAAEFDADRPLVVQRALAAGVCGAVVPGWRLDKLAEQRSVGLLMPSFRCWYAVGLHPLYLQDLSEVALTHLAQWVPGAVAIGEIGLDRFDVQCREPDYWRRQQFFFREQLALAQQARLPVLVHVRHCYPELLRELRRHPVDRGGIIHAFNGTQSDALALIDAGFVLGFGALITQPSAERLRRLLAALPADAWVLETDAPDMISHSLWQQGARRHEPAHLMFIVQSVAQCLGCTIQAVQQQHSGTLNRVLDLSSQSI